jgi:hypothetical protein
MCEPGDLARCDFEMQALFELADCFHAPIGADQFFFGE